MSRAHIEARANLALLRKSFSLGLDLTHSRTSRTKATPPTLLPQKLAIFHRRYARSRIELAPEIVARGTRNDRRRPHACSYQVAPTDASRPRKLLLAERRPLIPSKAPKKLWNQTLGAVANQCIRPVEPARQAGRTINSLAFFLMDRRMSRFKSNVGSKIGQLFDNLPRDFLVYRAVWRRGVCRDRTVRPGIASSRS